MSEGNASVIEQPAPQPFSEAAVDLYAPDPKPEDGGLDKGGQEDKSGEEGKSEQQRQDKPEIKTLTADEIDQRIKDATKPPEKQKEYTPEELDKIFKVWKPSDDFLTQIRSEDPAVAVKAITDMRDGLLEQFSTIQLHERALLLEQIRKEFSPVQSFAKEQAAKKEKDEFFKSNEDLKGQEELVNVVYKAMVQEGYKATDIAQARKDLAERVRKLVPNLSGTQQGNGSNNNNNSTSKPASLSSGSQAGGGSGGGKSAPANVFEEIWG
jgi:hypothetical protein